MIRLFFLLQVFFYLTGAMAGFLFAQRASLARLATHLLAAAGSAAGCVYSLGVLTGAGPFTFQTFALRPLGPAVFQCDLFSALFVAVISLPALACSIYAIGYTRECESRKNFGFLGLAYNLFLLSMILVVTVRHVFYFLVVWEMMSLASYFLVIHEHENPEARRAGFLYFIMTHIGTAFITAAFLLLAVQAGSFSFDWLSAKAVSIPAAWKNLVFIFALIGFGTKAGMVPMHLWLPEAHPQAPSHVSALMSGVMIKTALYAFLRVTVHFLGDVPPWWGTLILVLGLVSTLVGILYALMEHDLKRLLAFSSIENVGIILLGAGMMFVFISNRDRGLASFALAAALYHIVNHAVFKGLLFLGAGSVLFRTHTRDMEKLGGLIKTMPLTAAAFLTGSMAIAALPPLNGFVSEWMTFLALFLGIESPSTGMRFFTPLAASLLGFAGALAAMCFVKAMGITFLGMPRSAAAAHAREVPFSMQAGKIILAAGCLGLALAAPWVVALLGGITREVLNTEPSFSGRGPWGGITPPLAFGGFSPWMIPAVLLGICGALVFFIRIILGKTTFRRGPSWDCGVPALEPRMQYSATGYSKPIRRIFSFLFQPARRVEIEDEGHEILRTARHFESKIHPLFEEMFYRPVLKVVFIFSRKAKRIQTGHIQLYLSYIFVALVALLVYVRLSR